MANLQDIIKLSEADGGKFYVMDEQGEIKLVIVPVEEYQKLLEQKLATKLVAVQDEAEKINKEILKAQLTEQEAVQPVVEPPKTYPKARTENKFIDLREEVIDPSFDFEGPKMGLDDI